MSNNTALNSALISNALSKQQEFTSYSETNYPCENIKDIADYTLSLRCDKRAIATGVDATNYSPFQTLRTSDLVRNFAKSIGAFVNSIISLASPSSILINQSVINTHMITMLHEGIGCEINIVNGPYLHLYEKFCKQNSSLSLIPYNSYDKYEILSGITKKFDMIIVYADDIEGDLEYVDSIIGCLPVGGTLLIANSGNQGMLYNANDYAATPQSELHDFLNSNDSLVSCHVPLFIGFSIIKKIN